MVWRVEGSWWGGGRGSSDGAGGSVTKLVGIFNLLFSNANN